MSKNQPGTVEKNSSTIGPPAGIEPTPAGGPIVDEFFSTVPGWFFDMCMIQLELKTHLPFRIYPISSQMLQNLN